MFSKAKRGNDMHGADRPVAPSIISTDLRIVGDLISDGEIQIDGIVEGDIRARTLMIGEPAEVTGELFADSVAIYGTVTGQIKARSVSLAKTARMLGDIHHQDLSIEKGAFLEGHCRRASDEELASDRLRALELPAPPTQARIERDNEAELSDAGTLDAITRRGKRSGIVADEAVEEAL